MSSLQASSMRTAASCVRRQHVQQLLLVRRPSRAAHYRLSAAKAPSRDTAQNAPSEPEQLAASDSLQSSSAVSAVVAHPSTCLSALAGFALIASNIPVSSITDEQAVTENLPAQSAIQQLLANSGAAQAATMQAAESAQGVLQPVLTGSNPVLQLDEAIHQWVAGNTTLAFRLMADVWISDAFITAGIIGWVACTVACLMKAPTKSAGPLAAAWGFYATTCGAVSHGDPLLVDALKHFFARARPSTLHHTFSFPSGHTSAAVFIVGALLTVLLPLTVRLWSAQAADSSSSSSENSADSSGSSSNSSSDRSTDSVNSSAVSSRRGSSVGFASILALDATILGVWAAAWGMTATGRILSESHWLSDTMAGGMLAVASVSGLALTCRLLVPDQAVSTESAPTTGNASAQSDN